MTNLFKRRNLQGVIALVYGGVLSVCIFCAVATPWVDSIAPISPNPDIGLDLFVHLVKPAPPRESAQLNVSITKYYKTYQRTNCSGNHGWATTWTQVSDECTRRAIKAYKTILIFVYPDHTHQLPEGACTPCFGPEEDASVRETPPSWMVSNTLLVALASPSRSKIWEPEHSTSLLGQLYPDHRGSTILDPFANQPRDPEKASSSVLIFGGSCDNTFVQSDDRSPRIKILDNKGVS